MVYLLVSLPKMCCFRNDWTILHSLKLTFSLLKMDGWNTNSFPIGFRPIFRGYVPISFREGSYQNSTVWSKWRSKAWVRNQTCRNVQWITSLRYDGTMTNDNPLVFQNPPNTLWLGGCLEPHFRLSIRRCLWVQTPIRKQGIWKTRDHFSMQCKVHRKSPQSVPLIVSSFHLPTRFPLHTLQGTSGNYWNISHLGKRKIIFKHAKQ